MAEIYVIRVDVGIDVEQIKSIDFDIAKRFFSGIRKDMIDVLFICLLLSMISITF